MNLKARDNKVFGYALLIISGAFYFLLNYLTDRNNFLQLFFLFTLLFISYYFLFKFFSGSMFGLMVLAGILFRVLLLFSTPNLSEDVYRFIWDGRLAAEGINPFHFLPAEIIQAKHPTGLSIDLFNHLNSPGYFTIYPPVMQYIFFIAGKLFPVSIPAAIIFFKAIITIFETGTLIVMIALLKQYKMPHYTALLYFLNPLIITELTGNVHFDGVMIFFVVLSFMLLSKNKWQWSAISMGLAIASKIIPIIFLPLIISKVGWRKGLIYGALCGFTTLLLYLPILDSEMISSLTSGIDLFFQRFEFNASLYYITRYIGTYITGYNIIGVAGQHLP